MIRKNWLEKSGLVASVAVVLLFTFGLSGTWMDAQSAQAVVGGPVLRPSSPPAFLVAPSMSLGYSPTSIASGTLTSSGRIDLVTADTNAGKITVFTSMGHGTFAPGISYSAGSQPGSLIIADVDGDGKADVVLANASEGVISVFPGNGDGTLGARKTFAIGFAPSYIAVGDFTGNGKLDIAVLGAAGKSLAILQNDGTGNLKRPTNYALASTPAAIVTADFNHDGHLDLALANINGTVTVFLGKGNGQFSALPDVSVAGGALSSIAAADFDRDGNADLVVTSTATNQAAVLLGHGDGKFAPAAFLTVGNSPVATHVADVDGDGIPDLIVVNKGSNTFSILNGAGDGTFKNATHFVVGNAPMGAAAADFYGNGRVDLATINQLGQTMSVPASNGDGTFAAGRAYVAGVQPVSVASGDLTRSGQSDLVVASYCGTDATCGGSGSAAVLLGGPGGVYQLASTYAMGTGSIAIHLIDVNGDGKLDMVALNRLDKSVSIRLGAGDGTFGDLITVPLSASPVALATADFNKDGKIDLAVVGDCGLASCSQPGEVEFLLGTGDGNFHSLSTHAVGYSPVALALGSVSASGKTDVLVANRCGLDASCKSGGSATVLFGDGAGGFKPGADVALGNSPSSIALADLRGQGTLDLVVSRSTDNAIAVLPGAGNGSFGAAVPYAVGRAPGSLVVADFNGDGQLDVAVANTADSTVSVLFGSLGGKLQPAFAVPVAGNPSSLAAVASGTGKPGLAASAGSIATPVSAPDVTVVQNLNARPEVGAGGGMTTSSTALQSATNPSTVNQGVQLTATVTGQASSGNPSGFVAFYSDGTGSSNALSDCGGTTGLKVTAGAGATATVICSTSVLSGNTGAGHALTAIYLGDSIYDTSTSTPALAQVVNLASTTLTIAPPASASDVNTSVTFTATLHGTFTPTTPATGSTTTSTVAFYADSSSTPISGCATSPLEVNNGVYTATCSTNSLDATAHSVSATYSGDSNFSTSSTTSSASYTPTKAATTLTVAAPAPSAVNTSAIFTATLHGTFTPITPTTGSTTTSTISFVADAGTANAATLCTASQLTFSAGAYTATCNSNALDGTTHSISATYTGDTNFAGSSTTSSASYTPTQSTTSTTVSASAGSTAVNVNVTFTATISGTFTPVTPGGTVSFSAGGTPISTCTTQSISASGPNYIASCTTNALTAGVGISVVATYSGDASFKGSVSSGLPHTITALTPTLGISPSPGATVPVGTSVTFTAALSGATFTPTVPNGTVTWKINNTTNADCPPVTINASQKATCTTSSLVYPADTITASYSSDNNFTVANPVTITETVNKTGTAVNLSASTGSTTVNAPVMFTATVPAPAGQTGAPFPTGNVTFTQGSSNAVLCSGPVVLSTPTLPLSPTNQPKATCNTSFSSANSYQVSASYSGDGNFSPGTGGPVPVTVGATPVTVALTSSGTNFINQPVTFNVTLTPDFTGTAIPTGTVTITTTGATLTTDSCGATLNVSNGTVPSCSYTFTAASPAGGYTVTATFHPGDSNFTPKTPTTSISQTIDAGSSGISLSTSLSQSVVNQSVTFTASFNPPVTGSTKPKGQVVYTDGAAAIPNCTFNVNADGSIPPCAYAFTTTVAHSITAPFTSSDTNFKSATSNTISQTVNKAPTATVLVPSIAQSSVNQTVTFTATVTPTPTGSAIPTGIVAFSYNLNGTTTPICTTGTSTTLVAGTAGSGTAVATCALPFNASGSYTVTASYPGDGNFSAATPISITQTVSNAKPNITITPPASPMVNQQTSFSVELAPAFSGTVYPKGTVTFTDASDSKTIICAAQSLAQDAAVQGNSNATCNVTFLSGGSHAITVTYSGDTNFPGTTTTPPTTVAVAAAPSTIALTPTAPQIFANQTVLFTATMSPTAGANPKLAAPNGTVTFTSVDSGTALCSNVATASPGDGTTTATCSVAYPHTPGLIGQYTVSASFTPDGSASFKPSSTGTTSSTGAALVTVQDFNTVYTVTPKVQVGGSAILPATSGMYLTTGSTSGNDIFGQTDIGVAITTSAPYNPQMTVTCVVTPVNPLPTSANPVYPPTCDPNPGTVNIANNTGSQAFTLSTNLTGSVTSATPGEYQFTLTVSDQQHNPAGAQPSQTYTLFVVAPSATFTMAAGASSTENVSFNTAGVLQNSSLTQIQCQFIYGTDPVSKKMDVFSTSGLVSCSSSVPNVTVTDVSTSTPVKIDTSGTTATGQIVSGESGTMYAASVFAIPFLAILGWMGSRKSSRRNALRFFMGVVLILGLSWGISGCGGSFNVISKIPQSPGLQPGNYSVLVSATATLPDKSTTTVYAVVPVDVISN